MDDFAAGHVVWRNHPPESCHLSFAIIPPARNKLTSMRMKANNRPHASLSFVCDSIRSTPAERPSSRCHRKCCSPPATRSFPAKAETTAADLLRLAVLGRVVSRLAQLARPLFYVQADTVVRWQRERFRKFWANLSRVDRRRCGRPATAVDAVEIRRLIEAWWRPIRCGVRPGFTEN
jgi:hypothetical protein